MLRVISVIKLITKDTVFAYCKNCAYYLLIMTIVMFFCGMLPSMVYTSTHALEYARYDFRITECSSEDAQMLKSMDDVEQVFATRVLFCEIVAGDISVSIQIDFADAEYCENVEISPYSKEFLLRGELPSLDSEEPELAINHETANQLGIDVGDVVDIQIGLSDDDVIQYKISGIFEPNHISDGFGYALYDEYIHSSWSAIHGDEMPITTAWITSSDIESTQSFLINDYHWELLNEEGYSELEIRQINRQYNTSRIETLEQARSELNTLPTLAYTTAVAGALLFAVFVVREASRELQRNLEATSIVLALGGTKGSLVASFVIKQAVSFLPALLGACFAVNLLYLELLPGVYLPSSILLGAASIAFAVFMLGSFFGTLINLPSSRVNSVGKTKEEKE